MPEGLQTCQGPASDAFTDTSLASCGSSRPNLLAKAVLFIAHLGGFGFVFSPSTQGAGICRAPATVRGQIWGEVGRPDRGVSACFLLAPCLPSAAPALPLRGDSPQVWLQAQASMRPPLEKPIAWGGGAQTSHAMCSLAHGAGTEASEQDLCSRRHRKRRNLPVTHQHTLIE